MHNIFDVAIIGGGPSGASAAYPLARSGAHVVIIDKVSHPRYKTCGGGVVRRAAQLLPFDLETVIDHECNVAELNFLDCGLRFEVKDDCPLIHMTMRSRFDARLLSEAKRVGATVLSPCLVKEIVNRQDYVELVTNRSPVKTRLVIICAGAGSTLIKKAGWTQRLPLIPACEWEVYVDQKVLKTYYGKARFDFEVVPSGYAWVFPKNDHLSIGIASLKPGALRGPSTLAHYINRIGITKIQKVERHGYVIPTRLRKEPMAKGRIMLAGDAGGFIDPVTYEGITYAIRSGQLAARAILESGFKPSYVVHAYHKYLAKHIKPELRAGRVFGSILYHHPHISKWLFRRYGNALCHTLSGVITGEKSYPELLSKPVNYLKLLCRDIR